MQWVTEWAQLQPWLDALSAHEPGLSETSQKIQTSIDPIVVLVYIRHFIEQLVIPVYLQHMGKDPKSQPLQSLLQQLNQAKRLPHSVYDTLLHLNRLGTYGAHPKELDSQVNQEQVQHALILLPSLIKWHLTAHALPLPENPATGTLAHPKTTPLKLGRQTQPLSRLEKLARNPLYLAGWSAGFVMLGVVCVMVGLHFTLQRLQRQALQMEPSALLKAGYQAYQKQDYKLALAYYKRCIQLDNRYAAAYNNRALIRPRTSGQRP